MKTERFAFKSCCGTTSVAIKISSPLSKDFLPFLVDNGFTEAKHFTAAGILYIENTTMVVTGSFGSDTLQIKCKKGDKCEENVNNFEQLLTKMDDTT